MKEVKKVVVLIIGGFVVTGVIASIVICGGWAVSYLLGR